MIMSKSEKEKSNYDKNIDKFKKNEDTKNNVDQSLNKIYNDLSSETTFFQNIQSNLTDYYNSLKNFINSIENLIPKIQSLLNKEEEKNSSFNKNLIKLLLRSDEIFKNILQNLQNLILNFANQIEQNSIKYQKIQEMYKKVKDDFDQKYNINFNNYKNYITIYNKLEQNYIKNENNKKKNNKIKIIDINTSYDTYLKTNEELNNYCNINFPVAIEILNENKKNRIQSIDFLKESKKQLIKAFEFFINIKELEEEEKKEEEKEKEQEETKNGIETKEIEIKNEEKQKFDLSKVNFPFIKYHFYLINQIKKEENELSHNLDFSLSEKMINLMEKIIKDYPNIMKDEYNIEKERKKLKIRKLMSNLIEKNEIENNIDVTKQNLNDEFYRNYFLKYINQKRAKGKFQIKNPEAMKYFGEIMKYLLQFYENDKNFDNLKLIVIMSQTYYYINKNGKKIYLIKLIKDNTLFQNSEFWLNFLDQIINSELERELKRNNYDENEIKKNISLTKIMTIIQNMDECEVPKEIIEKTIEESFKKYNLSEELRKEIYLLLENIQEKEIKEFDIDNEIV